MSNRNEYDLFAKRHFNRSEVNRKCIENAYDMNTLVWASSYTQIFHMFQNFLRKYFDMYNVIFFFHILAFTRESHWQDNFVLT